MGFAVLLDKHGKIADIVDDGDGVLDETEKGKLFIMQVDAGSKTKFFRLLSDTRVKGMSTGHEVNLTIKDKLHSVFLIGIRKEDEILCVGTFSKESAEKYLNELVKINNEYANQLREMLKSSKNQEKDRIAVLESISEINAELLNVQRDLQLKNKMLDQQSRILEKLNEDKNRFLGMAAHDLRNPLGVIMNLSGILKESDGEVQAAEVAELSGVINESSRFMLALLEELLDLTVIESGNLRMNLAQENVVEVLNRTVELNRILATKKDIEITFESPCDEFLIKIDRRKIEQVMNNLISNALKFSQRGKSIEVVLTLENKECIVSVQDQGQGIPEDELGKIFGAFQKTSVQSTEGEKSTGLGLMIAQKVMKAHEGRIWVTSKVGEGTCFLFALPHENNLDDLSLERTADTPGASDSDAAKISERAVNVGESEMSGGTPLLVISSSDDFQTELHSSFPGSFSLKCCGMAKDFLLMSDIEAPLVFIDCANLDMPLNVVLAFAGRKEQKEKIILYNFDPAMMSEQELADYGVRQTLAAGAPLQDLEVLRELA